MNRIKAALLVSATLISAYAVAADDSPKTKLEAFSAKTGSVVIKGYSEVGSVTGMGSVSAIAMEFTDATSGTKQSGVVIEVRESGRLENSVRSFIDYDEIDSLVKGIDYISKTTSSVTKLGQFESSYRTKGNFNITTFNSKDGKVSAAVTSGYIRTASAYLPLEKLSDLRGLVLQAKQKLDEAK